MVAPDDTTFAYLEPRQYSPKGKLWEEALDYWRTLRTDDGAPFAREVRLDASRLEPYVTWGTNPAQAVPITGRVREAHDERAERALRYMDLKAGTALQDIAIDRVFIGSCTNSRIEDLRERPMSSAVAKSIPGSKRWSCPLDLGEADGREGGPRPGLQSGRFRVARRRLLTLPWHEPRHPGPGRALRVDQQPKTSRAGRAPADAPTW